MVLENSIGRLGDLGRHLQRLETVKENLTGSNDKAVLDEIDSLIAAAVEKSSLLSTAHGLTAWSNTPESRRRRPLEHHSHNMNGSRVVLAKRPKKKRD